MEKFNITKEELIKLCLESEIQFASYITRSDKCNAYVWQQINNVLNTPLSASCIEKNIVNVKEVFNMFGYYSITDVMVKEDCNKEDAVNYFKCLIVTETLNKSYFELLNKKLVIKFIGYSYVPKSLVLGITIRKLATTIEKEIILSTNQEIIINEAVNSIINEPVCS